MKRFLWLLPIFLLAFSAQAREGLLNKLLSPGPLALGHKKLEGADCVKCHELNKGIPNSKCLDCHKEIRPYLEKKTGLHGLTSKQCISCHSDHKGDSYDSTKIDVKSFEHRITGFELNGRHSAIRCHECHKTLRSEMMVRKNDLHYTGLKSGCIDCHLKDDVHFFDGKYRNKSCKECHGEDSWKRPLKFEHDKDTSFKLEGRHQSLKCNDCHRVGKNGPFKYQFPEIKGQQCLACHEDHHKDRFEAKFRGGDCLKCHSMEGWKLEKFNHSVTEFPLNGKHATIKCIDCHKQTDKKIPQKDFNFKGLKQDCLSCHENYHAFSKEPGRKYADLLNCKACHTETNWKSPFDHNSDTSFRIGGKHVGVKCMECHVRDPGNKKFRIYKWSLLDTKTCETCHKSPHRETFSRADLAKKCTECHVDTSWHNTRKSNFNHDISTRFKLDGRHREISCNDCHLKDEKHVYRFPSVDKKFCIDCHSNPHKRQLSEKLSEKNCLECHTTSSFQKLLSFDHSTTRFKLTGKHIPLKCEECHSSTPERFKTKPYHFKKKYLFETPNKEFCNDCHNNVHANQFHEKFSQKACSSCHSTENFEKRIPFDHYETGFPLRDSHEALSCNQCHVKTRNNFPLSHRFMNKYVFDSTAGDCQGCHKDVHHGEYGKQCASCHSEDYWRHSKNFHKDFTLKGVHQTLSCAECHRDGRKLQGMSNQCFFCHQKDDVHGGTLRKCEDCHRQAFWENSTFNHSLTRFALRGAHRTLECAACHATGMYKGISTDCWSCHRETAFAFNGSPNHRLLTNRSCLECHNQFSFH